MNKNTKVIYKRIEEDFYEKGYINLNHRLVNTKDDLVEIASIFRDERYETFRVVFMKGNNIVGYESITSKMLLTSTDSVMRLSSSISSVSM